MLILDLQKKHNLGLAKEERLKIWKKVAKSSELEEFFERNFFKTWYYQSILEANESSPGRPSVQSCTILTRP